MPQSGDRMSCQMKPMMTTDSIVGRKIERAVDGSPGQCRQAEEHRQREPDRVLHDHVDGEEDEVVPERVPERTRPARVGQKGDEIAEADEAQLRRLPSVAIEAEADRVERAGRSRRACRRSPPGRGRRSTCVDHGTASRVSMRATVDFDGGARVMPARRALAGSGRLGKGAPAPCPRVTRRDAAAKPRGHGAGDASAYPDSAGARAATPPRPARVR